MTEPLAEKVRLAAVGDRMANALKAIHDKHPEIVMGVGAYEDWRRLGGALTAEEEESWQAGYSLIGQPYPGPLDGGPDGR